MLDNGAWVSAGDTILGANNKAAVAVLLEVAHRCCGRRLAIGVELLFTVCEEQGSPAPRLRRRPLRSDWATSSTTRRRSARSSSRRRPTTGFEASFRGAAAHAGIRPEDGRSAIDAAARAIAAMRLGRLDEETTRTSARSGGPAHEHRPRALPDRGARSARWTREGRGGRRRAHRPHPRRSQHPAACAYDVDVITERLFDGYRHAANAPAVLAAEPALRARGYKPTRRATGGGSDANASVQGFD